MGSPRFIFMFFGDGKYRNTVPRAVIINIDTVSSIFIINVVNAVVQYLGSAKKSSLHLAIQGESRKTNESTSCLCW